jgi:prepilin-type N-terminal cleavage/methylation domain-containing protein
MIRRGITLIELLVVITIILLLATVALPVMAPSRQGRKMREAARSITAYLGAARSEAMTKGRPVGVSFTLTTTTTSGATLNYALATMVQVGEQEPYGGDTDTAMAQFRIRMSPIAAPPKPETGTVRGPVAVEEQPLALEAKVPRGWFTRYNFADSGGMFQINYQGPKYRLLGPIHDRDPIPPVEPDDVDPTKFQDLLLEISQAYYTTNAPPGLPVLPFPRERLDLSSPGDPAQPWSEPLPFQCFPAPTRSATPPLELPAGIVIDSQWSGTDSRSYSVIVGDADWNTSTPRIMFLPSGEVRGYKEPLYLLVGERNRVWGMYTLSDQPMENEYPNWYVSTNLWVVIEPRTGLATVRENYCPFTDDDWGALTNPGQRPTWIPSSIPWNTTKFNWAVSGSWANAAYIMSRRLARGATDQGGDDVLGGK